MPKIAFIGAGSTVFARNLIGDVLRFPALANSTTFALMDIDPERLRTTELAALALSRSHGAGPAIEATVDRLSALDGPNYVVTSFQDGCLHPSPVYDLVFP